MHQKKYTNWRLELQTTNKELLAWENSLKIGELVEWTK